MTQLLEIRGIVFSNREREWERSLSVHLWLPLSIPYQGKMVTLFPFEDDETLCGIPIAGAEVVDWRGQQLCSRCCQEYEDHLAEYIGEVPEFSAFARRLGAPTIGGHWRQYGMSAERDREQMRALIARNGKPSSVAEAALWLFGSGRTSGRYWERALKALRGVESCNP